MRSLLAALLLAFVAQGSIHAESPKSSKVKSESNGQPELGAQFAARMEDLLARLKETSYQETTEINEGKGVVKCDCSALVGTGTLAVILHFAYPRLWTFRHRPFLFPRSIG